MQYKNKKKEVPSRIGRAELMVGEALTLIYIIMKILEKL
jgi:hypothetical protein